MKTVGRKRKIKKIRQEDKKKKDEKKKRRRGWFEPETFRLGISSLDNYATQHLTLKACNC